MTVLKNMFITCLNCGNLELIKDKTGKTIFAIIVDSTICESKICNKSYCNEKCSRWQNNCKED